MIQWARTSSAWVRWQVRSFVYRRRFSFAVGLVVVAATSLYLLPDIVVTIEPGHSGVLWARFSGGTDTAEKSNFQIVESEDMNSAADGTVGSEPANPVAFSRPKYPEGTHFKWPWNRVYPYDIRLQALTTTFDALSSDGLSVSLTVAMRWMLVEQDLGALHKEIGPKYLDSMLLPTLSSIVRHELAEHTSLELFSSVRLEMQARVLARMKEDMTLKYRPQDARESYVVVEDVLFAGVVLPPSVANAINDKMIAQQRSDAYRYRLSSERQESERKAIEADGIRAFQATVNSSISPGYLQWKGIDATLELAKSNNAKVVVIGGGKDGMPIILGGLDNNNPPTVSVAAATATPPAPPPLSGRKSP